MTTSKTSTQQSQTSSTTPYGPAGGTIDALLAKIKGQTNAGDLTGVESGALDTIESNAAKGNPFSGDISSLAKGLLSGGGAQANDSAIKGALDNYTGLLTPYANGSMIGKNEALQGQLDTIKDDVTNQVNGMFAGAGRDLSGANIQALARGIAQGTAPVIASQFNTDTANSLNAANSLYGAANSTYGLLNQNKQQANNNAVSGIDVGNQALSADNYGALQTLAAEAQRRGIPLSTIQTLLGTVLPTATAFGTTTGQGTSNTEKTASPLEAALGVSKILFG
jgi:hypothetical protein